jgi:hypothetical protein
MTTKSSTSVNARRPQRLEENMEITQKRKTLDFSLLFVMLKDSPLKDNADAVFPANQHFPEYFL